MVSPVSTRFSAASSPRFAAGLPRSHERFQRLEVTLPGLDEGISLGYVNAKSRELRPYKGPDGPEAGLSVTDWPAVQAAPQSIALETAGMCGCAAFTIQEPADAFFTFRWRKQPPKTLEPRHLIGHLNPPKALTWTPKLLNDVLDALASPKNPRPWSLDKSTITIMPGISDETLTTVNQLQTVLHERSPSLLNRVRYVHYPRQVVDDLEFPARRHGVKHFVSPSVILAYATSLVSYRGQHFWRRVPSDKRSFTDTSHRLNRMDFNPAFNPGATLEVYPKPEKTPRFGATQPTRPTVITPALQAMGWTPGMAETIESVLAQCHYGHRPEQLVNPNTGRVSADAFVHILPHAQDKQLVLTGTAPEFKTHPPFDGTCSHLVLQAWEYLAKTPETSSLMFQPLDGPQADYFRTGAHVTMLAWPKAIHPQVEPILARLDVPLSAEQWMDRLPEGVAVIDPSFKRWAIKSADNPDWRQQMAAMGLGITKWATHPSVDFRLPTYNVNFSLRNRAKIDPDTPKHLRPVYLRSYPLGYAAEWLPERVPDELGSTRPAHPTMLMLGVADVDQDMTTPQGAMALVSFARPHQPAELVMGLPREPHPLTRLVNHLNRQLKRPTAEHQQAHRAFLAASYLAPTGDPLANLVRQILGDNAPTDPERLALIIGMLRESGVLNQDNPPPKPGP